MALLKTAFFKGLTVFCFFLNAACSPLRSSASEEKHQLELTLHELQTALDDQRHDQNCFQTELQILDGRIKYNESALTAFKQKDLEKSQASIHQLEQKLVLLEKRLATFERSQHQGNQDVQQLTLYANETTVTLSQFKERILELEQTLKSQGHLFEEMLAKQSSGVKVHIVRLGDTLEKIARLHKTTVERIKIKNRFNQDLIVVGQELHIPDAIEQ
jgi:chromosome segregation ATPase